MRPDTIILPEYHTYIWPGGETETHLMGSTERWHRLRYHRPGAHRTSISVYCPRGSSDANRVTIREYSDEDEDDEVTIIKEEDSDEDEDDEVTIIKEEDSDEDEDDEVAVIKEEESDEDEDDKITIITITDDEESDDDESEEVAIIKEEESDEDEDDKITIITITDDEESDDDEKDEAAIIKEEDGDEDEGDISFNTNEEKCCSQNTVAISEHTREAWEEQVMDDQNEMASQVVNNVPQQFSQHNTQTVNPEFDPGNTGSESAHHISKEGGAALYLLNESLSLRDVKSRKRGRSQDLEPELRECKVRRTRNSSV